MRTVRDLTGKRFGRLVITARDGKTQGSAIVQVRCDCGTEKTVRYGDLRSGDTVSCGCLRNERVSAAVKTHGLTRTPIYRVWHNMRARCTYPNHRSWPRYGGRGIRVCDEWSSFGQFFADFGHTWPGDGYQLDRIDNDGNYEPGNVRWATRSEQARNKDYAFMRRRNVVVE
jgi:hypothetical protein